MFDDVFAGSMWNRRESSSHYGWKRYNANFWLITRTFKFSYEWIYHILEFISTLFSFSFENVLDLSILIMKIDGNSRIQIVISCFETPFFPPSWGCFLGYMLLTIDTVYRWLVANFWSRKFCVCYALIKQLFCLLWPSLNLLIWFNVMCAGMVCGTLEGLYIFYFRGCFTLFFVFVFVFDFNFFFK